MSFFKYQDIVNHDVHKYRHMVINEYICRNGMDYRYEVCANPIPELRNRCKVMTTDVYVWINVTADAGTKY